MSRTRHHGDKAKERLFASAWQWYGSEPKWWNKMHHIRPRRQSERLLEHKTLRGEPELVWPPGNHKPHEYYW